MAKNRINIAIGANLKKFSTDMQNVKREMRKTSRKMKSLGQSMTRSLTVPLGLMGGAMIKFASDTQESLNKERIGVFLFLAFFENFWCFSLKTIE